MLSVIILNVIMLSVIMLSGIMLSVIMLSGIMLGVLNLYHYAEGRCAECRRAKVTTHTMTQSCPFLASKEKVSICQQ